MAGGLPSLLARRDRRNAALREALLRRVLDEFNEMPTLRLTRPQAQRLFGLRQDVCERVLQMLVQNGTLMVGHDARYQLNDSATWPGRDVFVRHVTRVSRAADSLELVGEF